MDRSLDRRSVQHFKLDFQIDEQHKLLRAINTVNGLSYEDFVLDPNPPANSHQSARPHPDENGAIKMSRGDAYWWIQRGDVDIAHPPTLTHSAIHNPSPGDLWVYFCRGARHIWLREEDSWRRLSADAGTWNGRADRADQVQHPSGSDQWLKFPLEGKPSWLKRASFKGLLKTPRS